MDDCLLVFYYLLVDPPTAMRQAINKKLWASFGVVSLTSVVSFVVGTNLLFTHGWGGPSFLLGCFLLGSIFFLIVWLAISSSVHACAELWGKRGRMVDTFLGIGISFFPAIFVTPFSLVADVLGKGKVLFVIVLGIFFLVWFISLVFTAVREIYTCVNYEVVIILLTPILFVIFILLLLPLSLMFLVL